MSPRVSIAFSDTGAMSGAGWRAIWANCGQVRPNRPTPPRGLRSLIIAVIPVEFDSMRVSQRTPPHAAPAAGAQRAPGPGESGTGAAATPGAQAHSQQPRRGSTARLHSRGGSAAWSPASSPSWASAAPPPTARRPAAGRSSAMRPAFWGAEIPGGARSCAIPALRSQPRRRRRSRSAAAGRVLGSTRGSGVEPPKKVTEPMPLITCANRARRVSREVWCMARSTGVKTAELEEGAREEERISERSRRSGAVSAVLTGFAPTLL